MIFTMKEYENIFKVFVIQMLLKKNKSVEVHS